MIVFGGLLTNLPSNAAKYCDVIVDSNLGSGNYESRSFLDKTTKTLYLQGLKYLVLKKDFDLKRSVNKTNLRKITLIFGGSDPSNFTSLVITKLLALDSVFNVDIIIGAAFIYHEELSNAVNTHFKGKRVKIYKDIDNVAELMYNADLVITSPGLSMLESLYIGIPTIAVCQNDLQAFAYRNFPFVYSPEQFFDKFSIVIFNANREYIIKRNDINSMEIGKGKMEIINAILGGADS